MIIAVPKETCPGEKRVALVPSAAAGLVKDGHQVRLEQGAGVESGFDDQQYRQRGVEVIDDRGRLIAQAEMTLQVRTPGANPQAGMNDLPHFRSGQILIGLAEPLLALEAIKALAERGVILLALELLPRITRAQSMDVLSSQANLAGYKAVIRAADLLGRIFPMMMTAAGTLQPARVFVIGAGVAGLQAIATANRLGAIVSAFDVRPVVKEQVESVGGRFVQLPLDTAAAQDSSGYARAQSEDQLRRQRELMQRVVAESDVVITTALVPGQRAPILVTRAMVEAMPSGGVIVDLAAERGGNCELTQPGQTIRHGSITIVGDPNLVSSAAQHASQMYANNLVNLLRHLFWARKGEAAAPSQPRLDESDEIVAGILVCRDGQVVHPRVRELMGLEPLQRVPQPTPTAG